MADGNYPHFCMAIYSVTRSIFRMVAVCCILGSQVRCQVNVMLIAILGTNIVKKYKHYDFYLIWYATQGTVIVWKREQKLQASAS